MSPVGSWSRIELEKLMLQDDLGRLTPLAFRRGHKEIVENIVMFWWSGLYFVNFPEGTKSFTLLHLARQFRDSLIEMKT